MDKHIAELLELEQRLRGAESLAQLFYTIVNQTHQCIPYIQAVLLTNNSLQRIQVVAASDIPVIDYTAPFVTWAESLGKTLVTETSSADIHAINQSEVAGELHREWRDMAPDHLLLLPLTVAARNNEAIGYLLLFRDKAWSDSEKKIAQHLAQSIGHALFALIRPGFFGEILKKISSRKIAGIAVMTLFATLWWPVRLSTLAPVEVIAKDPQVISAPMNGVIRQLNVKPNEVINAGRLLLNFEETELKSEFEIAEQSLNVALAELKTVQHSGFIKPSLKAELAELEANVRLKTAERDYAEKRLMKASVFASGSGVAVLEDPNSWKGRPVNVGERIMLLASPDKIELEIMLAVKDSIALQEGAEVKVFFDHAPLAARSGKVEHAGYEPQRTTEGQMAYRLVAALIPQGDMDELPRIGMRGTARVYGESVSLFFLLFRRPITSVRQWLGW